MRDLSGKTALITGGASGIGLSIAKALLKAGMKVAIGDVCDEHLAQARTELAASERFFAQRLDVTDRDGFRLFVDAVESRFGHLHLLVNNAGVAISGPTEQASFNDWDWVMGVNLGGAINGIVTCLPRMLAHGEGGHIVNTCSTSGLLPHPGPAIYVASKAALIGLSESMRAELESKGVVVSAFCPGPVFSNIAESQKVRPAALGESGFKESANAIPADVDVSCMLRNPDDVGEIVREGIEKDYLYIFTHSEYRAGLAERAAAIMAAVPDTPENPQAKTLFASILRNPAHGAEIERHSSV